MTGREFEYVAVGHVTIDLLPADGLSVQQRRQPGGGAFYSALQAARLGLRTLLLTRGQPEELEALLEPYREELEVRIEPAPHTTTLQTSGFGPARSQRLLAWAGPIEEPRLDTEILHLAAVARETPSSWSGRAAFVGLTPQGLLRHWDKDGHIQLAGDPRLQLPERLDAVVISELELGAWTALEALTASSRLLAVTAGSGPTTIFLPGSEPISIPAARISAPRDDLGAGDVFAAALFVSLRAGLSPLDAAARASAAAAVRIEGHRPDAIGGLPAIEARERRMSEERTMSEQSLSGR